MRELSFFSCDYFIFYFFLFVEGFGCFFGLCGSTCCVCACVRVSIIIIIFIYFNWNSLRIRAHQQPQARHAIRWHEARQIHWVENNRPLQQRWLEDDDDDETRRTKNSAMVGCHRWRWVRPVRWDCVALWCRCYSCAPLYLKKTKTQIYQQRKKNSSTSPLTCPLQPPISVSVQKEVSSGPVPIPFGPRFGGSSKIFFLSYFFFLRKSQNKNKKKPENSLTLICRHLGAATVPVNHDIMVRLIAGHDCGREWIGWREWCEQ